VCAWPNRFFVLDYRSTIVFCPYQGTKLRLRVHESSRQRLLLIQFGWLCTMLLLWFLCYLRHHCDHRVPTSYSNSLKTKWNHSWIPIQRCFDVAANQLRAHQACRTFRFSTDTRIQHPRHEVLVQRKPNDNNNFRSSRDVRNGQLDVSNQLLELAFTRREWSDLLRSWWTHILRIIRLRTADTKFHNKRILRLSWLRRAFNISFKQSYWHLSGCFGRPTNLARCLLSIQKKEKRRVGRIKED